MIKKIYRLKEREVKKVLRVGKPFFSYGVVLNSAANKLPYNRFAIVVGSKSVKTSVARNFFRRRFYDFIATRFFSDEKNADFTKSKIGKQKDFVFVVKKQTKLDKTDKMSIKNFEKDLNFLTKK